MDFKNNWSICVKGCVCLFMVKGLRGEEKKGLRDCFFLYLDGKKLKLIYLYIKEIIKYILLNIIYKEKEWFINKLNIIKLVYCKEIKFYLIVLGILI